MKKASEQTVSLVQMSILGAIIMILAFTPFIGYIPLGITKATIIHIPVIIGSIILGPKKGAVLGSIFGLTSLIMNTINPSIASFTFSPFYSLGDISGNVWSLVICFVPRILVGVVPYYVYHGLKNLNFKGKETFALAVAGLAGSLTNTLLVMNMIFIFFKDSYATIKNIAVETLYNTILGIIGINGVPEALLAALLTVAIVKALLKSAKI